MWTEEELGSPDAGQDELTDAAPSTAIAIKLSERLGKDVTELEPVGQTIDTDALDRLVERSASREFRFEFQHEGCLVELEQSEVSVTKLEQPSD
ncbi:HalOD1 output domain-containing protein [Halomicroarcula sp. GCM10025324]|jgi:hypothetical protein|uniref:HalOD1 output domain-containing protein n=1 Tax=Haloarcula TaxID=2237 RepID=UPI0023E8F301|nr:HalOD1 output domain-containing protein [Halomicroarcula sp. ZS-22-S1]